MPNIIELTIFPMNTGVYRVVNTKLDILRDLSAADYTDFREDLDFAGVSRRGKILSVPGSKGPAAISGYPVHAETPGDDWVELGDYAAGLLITADTPTALIAFCSPCRHASARMFIPRAHLIDRYEARSSPPDGSEYPDDDIVTVSAAVAVAFRSRYSTFRIVQTRHGYLLFIPAGTRMAAAEWRHLGRYLFTGNAEGVFAETVPVCAHDSVPFPGKTAKDVEAAFGIVGNPNGYQHGRLLFATFRVLDAIKAATLYPALGHFRGKTIRTHPVSAVTRFKMEDFLQNPQLVAISPSISVTPDLTEVLIPSERPPLAHLEFPLRNSEGRNTLCPQRMVDRFFLSARATSIDYALDKLTRHRLQIGPGENDLAPGRWIFRQDLSTLKRRARRSEAHSRKERRLRMEAMYGTLPTAWEELTDEEVAEYFRIRALIGANELMEWSSSPVLPEAWNHRNQIREFLRAQGHVVRCPLTKVDYIPAFRTLDDLASVPGFWPMLEAMFCEKRWLRELLNCPTVLTLAVAELI